MKRPQWITVAAALALLVILYFFGRTTPEKGPPATQEAAQGAAINADTVINEAKKRLSTDQLIRLNSLEHSLVRGNVKEQQLNIYHQLAHFWLDTGQVFEPYAWYEGQAARLENSEKTLTFAAHLFLQNLRGESDPSLRIWKAMQAKDLFERSLKINPNNDSSTVGLGACYVFGNISSTPMEGILKVRAVAEKDSTNIFAQEVLGHGSLLSGQYDRAIARFEAVYRLAKGNTEKELEACLVLGDAYERKADKKSAVSWYERSLAFIKNGQLKEEVQNRIDELKK